MRWRRGCPCRGGPPTPRELAGVSRSVPPGTVHLAQGPRGTPYALAPPLPHQRAPPQRTLRARRSAKGWRTAPPFAEQTGPVRFRPARPWLGRVGAKALAAAKEARTATAVRIVRVCFQNGGRFTSHPWRPSLKLSNRHSLHTVGPLSVLD